MSLDASRFAISLALVPLYVGTHRLVIDFCDSQDVVDSEKCAIVAAAFVVMVVWVLLWRAQVKWSARVIVATSILALCPVASVFISWGQIHDRAIPIAAPFIALAVWLAGTAWLWRSRETSIRFAVGDSEQIRCPQCNYSLKGLKEVHCPECGWTSTVDQIVKLAFENAATV